MVRPVRSLPSVIGDVFELRVSLRDIEPAVWRALRVLADVSLGVLHEVLRTAFGSQHCHLHDFRVGDVRVGKSDIDDEMFVVDEGAAPLGAIARSGSTPVYRYDFGDDWKHDIVVERVEPDGDRTIICTGGARACPPEDCGPPGYAEMLEALASPNYEQHGKVKGWAPRAARRLDVQRDVAEQEGSGACRRRSRGLASSSATTATR